MTNVIPLPRDLVPAAIRELAADVTLEELQRAHLAATAALDPPRQSTLIAMLPGATPAERELLLRELEARR